MNEMFFSAVCPPGERGAVDGAVVVSNVKERRDRLSPDFDWKERSAFHARD
jgi:hypothetical protein